MASLTNPLTKTQILRLINADIIKLIAEKSAIDFSRIFSVPWGAGTSNIDGHILAISDGNSYSGAAQRLFVGGLQVGSTLSYGNRGASIAPISKGIAYNATDGNGAKELYLIPAKGD